MELANFALSTITAFFAITNPIANIPIFMGLILAIISVNMAIEGIKIAFHV